MNTQTLHEKLDAVVAQCAASEEGRQALAMYEHMVQFTPLDGDPFYLKSQGGEITLHEGAMPETPITDAHEIKAQTDVFAQWFGGEERMSDLIEHGQMFPVASHTTKRHIDHWLAKIVRLGNGQKAPHEVY